MFGECKKCNFDAGYFQLNDRLCQSCITNEGKIEKQGNLSRVFKNMPFLLSFILLAMFINIIAIIVPSLIPEKLSIFTGANGEAFYITIIMVIIPIIISLIVRFLIARRRVHIIFTLAILFPIFAPIAALSKVMFVGGAPPLIALLSIVAAFRILRLENRQITGLVENG